MIINENRTVTYNKPFNELVVDTNTKTKFEKDYLPVLEKTTDKDIYILTNKYIYSNIGACHHKYFHFDKEGKLLTDPRYNYTKLDLEGFLMKIILRYPITEEFTLGYFIKLDNLVFNKSNCIDKNKVKETLIFDNVRDHNTIIAEPLKSTILNSKEFFKKYLDYDLK